MTQGGRVVEHMSIDQRDNKGHRLESRDSLASTGMLVAVRPTRYYQVVNLSGSTGVPSPALLYCPRVDL